ncbi:MAG: FtsQ-type POTRA domain-containing protein [Kiritimatiellae bacterium]|nr:FtsQ-type POTRA domain-containing protein [Kiritimatiellia bacterium]
MRGNRKTRATLFSAARSNRKRDDGSSLKIISGVVLSVALVALAAGVFFAFTHLRRLWLEQSTITDVARQVTIVTGSHVKSGVILDGFGLTNGANLATIDFKARRSELLGKVANIRSLSIERHLPDRVVITVAEREPVARLGVKGQKGTTGKVVDAEGVVFLRRVGTGMLPVIREARAPGTLPGKTLSGRAAAALKVVVACADGDLASLGILEVDASPRDYLLAVLGNYQRAKIAWEGMDEPVAGADDNMRTRLSNLRKAVNSNIATRAIIWNATERGCITADTKEPIQ